MLALSYRPASSATTRLSTFRLGQVRRTFSSTKLRLSDKNDSIWPSSARPHGLSTDPSRAPSGQIVEPQNTSKGFDAVKHQLRVWTTRNAIVLRQKMDMFSANARVAFAQLGGRLNEVTGYREIEQLKKLVVENEQKMADVREAARAAKEGYENAVSRRASSQREVNDLLQRKSSWTDLDVMRFTELVRQDHLCEQEEARAKAAVTETDEKVEAQFNELMRAILSRYHEEQVWSDKIRSASTYGSLAALGLNLAVFILAIVLVEPWKRRRLVQSFEARVLELNAKNQMVIEDGLEELRQHQAAQEKLLGEIQSAQTAFNSLSSEANEEHTELGPSLDQDVNAKATRDRQLIMIASTASAVGAGILGWLIGSKFG